MRNRFHFMLMLSGLAVVITSGVSDVNSNAAPLGSTGAPGEFRCAKSTCHSGSAVNSGIASLNINVDSSNLEATGTYHITVSLQQTGIQRFGFQVLALNSNNENTGSFILTDSTRTQLQEGNGPFAGRKYITYTYAGTEPHAAGLGQWSFLWEAPVDYHGDVTFYVAAVAANNDATDAGDTVYIGQQTLHTAISGIKNINDPETEVSIYPNPASSFFKVKYTTSDLSESDITLYDINSMNVCASLSRTDHKGEQNATINTTNLPAGTYLLRLRHDQKMETRKIIIEK